MTPRSWRALWPLAALALAAPAAAQSFTLLPAGTRPSGGWAGGLSAGGDFVVGWDSTGGGSFIWSAAGGKVNIGGEWAAAVSIDGTKVLGVIKNASNLKEAAIWDAGTGLWSGLDSFVGGTSCDSSYTTAYDLSDDGADATGLAWEGCKARAFHWTSAAVPAMVALTQQNPAVSARGNCVSGDGRFVGGWERDSTGGDRAVIWKPDGTQIFPAVSPSNPNGYGGTWGFSTDGTFACGEGAFNAQPAWLWSEAGGLVELPILAFSGPSDQHFATAVADDGKTVVGYRGDPFFGNPYRPWIWTEAGGTQDLVDFLGAKGVTVTTPLYTCFDMSADGRTFMGAVPGAIGTGDGWVASLAHPITDLGGSSAGTGGLHPALSADGTFNPGAPLGLHLEDAGGSAISVLIISVQNIPVPIFGGILHAFPIDSIQTLLTSPTGGWDVSSTWPPAMVSGISLHFQSAVFDPGAIGQFALSNALRATTP